MNLLLYCVVNFQVCIKLEFRRRKSIIGLAKSEAREERERAAMGKKKEKSVNVSGKPKHSLDVNRPNAKGKVDKTMRSAATVRRLKMANQRPKRDRKGHILWHDLQSKDLPNTRIEPDRRWFGAHPQRSPSYSFL